MRPPKWNKKCPGAFFFLREQKSLFCFVWPCPILSYFLRVSVKCPNFDCPNVPIVKGPQKCPILSYFFKSKCQMSELWLSEFQLSEFQLSEFRQKHKNELNDPIVKGPQKCLIMSHFLSVSVKCPNFDCPNLDSKNGGLSKITQWCVNVPGVYVMMG
jgi:hypothetical protein